MIGMTLERAAELVASLKGNAAIDLFSHFEELFHLHEQDQNGLALTAFAELCGFISCTTVRKTP